MSTENNNKNNNIEEKPKLKIKQNYINQLDLSWQYATSEYLNNININNNCFNIDNNNNNNNNEKEELDKYLSELKEMLFTEFKDSIEILENESISSQQDKIKQQQQQQPHKQPSSIKLLSQFENETTDPLLIQQANQLQKQLEQLVLKVTQLRQDVPSIIQAEVSQNIQKLSSLLDVSNNYNNNNNNNNNIGIPTTPLNKQQSSTKLNITNTAKKGTNKSNTNTNNNLPSNDEKEKEQREKEQKEYHESVLMIVKNISENFQSISVESNETRSKINDILNKSKQATEVSRILLKQ